MPFTKTALNKTKKDDLVQMFLDQQAKLNDVILSAKSELGNMPGLYNENKKLKEENEKLKKDNDEWETEYCRIESNFESLECDNKKLKEELKKYSIPSTSSEYRALFVKLGISADGLRGKKAFADEYKKYMEPLELRDEVEKHKDTILSLKSAVDDLREARDMRDLKIKELKQQVDNAYKQLNGLMSKVTLLKDEIESDSESEEEEDECVCCGTNFILNEELRHASPERRTKYEDYFGSEADMGDICPECLDKIY